jgi:DNA polymerase III subunit delta
MPSAYANQLAPALAKNPALVLLWGDDAGAVRQATAQAIAASGVAPTDPFAADKLNVAEVTANPARLIDAATTLPFGGGRKLVVVGGASGTEDVNTVKALTEAIAALLQFNITNTTVVLPLPGVLAKNSPLVKLVTDAPAGLVVRFYADNARDLAAYVQRVVAAAGVKIEPSALSTLVAGLGADREIAARELDKLLLYVQPSTTITLADVQASLSGAPKVDVFALADAVGSRNPAHTDTLLALMLAEGEDLEGAFNAVLRHLRLVGQGQALLAAGEAEGTVLTKLGKGGVPNDAKALFLQHVKTYPAGRLKTLPQYTFSTLATARRYGPTAPLTLARAVLALSA